MSLMGQLLSNMQSALASLASPSTTVRTGVQVKALKESGISSHHKSYAEVALADIIKAVQSVVADSFKSKSHDDYADTSVIIFGLPESKNDISKVCKLLEENIQSVVHVQRIGKLTKAMKPASKSDHPTSSRPVKVQLKSQEDKSWVLRNVKLLICAYGDSIMRIIKYLSSNELSNLKKFDRNHSCRIFSSNLNAFFSKLASGKNR